MNNFFSDVDVFIAILLGKRFNDFTSITLKKVGEKACLLLWLRLYGRNIVLCLHIIWACVVCRSAFGPDKINSFIKIKKFY